MRILTLQNFPSTPVGQVGEAIENLGGEVVVKHVYKDDPVPSDVDFYDGTIVLGGAQSAAPIDDAKYPTFGPIMQLIRNFHEADRPPVSRRKKARPGREQAYGADRAHNEERIEDAAPVTLRDETRDLQTG